MYAHKSARPRASTKLAMQWQLGQASAGARSQVPELCAGNNEQELQGEAGVVALTPLPPTQTTLLCSLRVFSVKYSPTIGPTASGDRAARATSGARRTPLSARNKRVPARQDRFHAGQTAAWDGITGRAPHGKRWGRSPDASMLGRFERSHRIGHNKRGARKHRDRPAYDEKGPLITRGARLRRALPWVHSAGQWRLATIGSVEATPLR